MSRLRGRIRRPAPAASLPLTSLLDVMTNLLVFLLVVSEPATAPADVRTPVSTGGEPVVARAVTVDVSLRDVRVDGVPVVALVVAAGRVSVPDEAREDGTIGPLRDRLAALAPGDRGDAEILLRCDHRLPFEVVREVLATAGGAGFGAFRFVVAPEGP